MDGESRMKKIIILMILLIVSLNCADVQSNVIYMETYNGVKRCRTQYDFYSSAGHYKCSIIIDPITLRRFIINNNNIILEIKDKQ